jgi:hypothetical protein
MSKIIGNTTATPNPRPDWEQNDATKADHIKNRPFYEETTGEIHKLDAKFLPEHVHDDRYVKLEDATVPTIKIGNTEFTETQLNALLNGDVPKNVDSSIYKAENVTVVLQRGDAVYYYSTERIEGGMLITINYNENRGAIMVGSQDQPAEKIDSLSYESNVNGLRAKAIIIPNPIDVAIDSNFSSEYEVQICNKYYVLNSRLIWNSILNAYTASATVYSLKGVPSLCAITEVGKTIPIQTSVFVSKASIAYELDAETKCIVSSGMSPSIDISSGQNQPCMVVEATDIDHFVTGDKVASKVLYCYNDQNASDATGTITAGVLLSVVIPNIKDS